MPTVVDFTQVSSAGLESSPAAAALAGLRANESRYYTSGPSRAYGAQKPLCKSYAARRVRTGYGRGERDY